MHRLGSTAPLLRPPGSGRDAGERFDLLKLLASRVSRKRESAADLEQTHPGLLPPQIFAAGMHKTGPQRHAHLAQGRGDRIRNLEARRIPEYPFLPLRSDQPILDPPPLPPTPPLHHTPP